LTEGIKIAWYLVWGVSSNIRMAFGGIGWKHSM